jgi:hypothetical protein
MTGTWRDFRPAIWATFLGIAVALLVSPWAWSGVFFGAAILLAARVPVLRSRAPQRSQGRSKPDRRQRRR